jgi:hypothetical protein
MREWKSKLMAAEEEEDTQIAMDAQGITLRVACRYCDDVTAVQLHWGDLVAMANWRPEMVQGAVVERAGAGRYMVGVPCQKQPGKYAARPVGLEQILGWIEAARAQRYIR